MGSRAAGPKSIAAALAIAAVVVFAACATTVQQEIAQAPPVSVENLTYYPFQVKGYQGSYPRRRILVLMPIDARGFKDVSGQNHQPYSGNPATGILLGPDGAVVQHIYSTPLGPTVQGAIVRSADEAGLIATASNQALPAALKQTGEDYVLASRIVRCWVNKHAGVDPNAAPGSIAWFTTADVAIDVTLYKPPFNVAFWQGESAATYNDPPADNGNGMGDDVPIYDHPGEVLSVAMTRAVAGIFKREGLHSLIVQDATGAAR